jgi:dipeptidyl aminopeptidase/acylaminoacyl peptidase
MRRRKYIPILLFLFAFLSLSHYAYALDVQYGAVIGSKGSSVLIEYYGIEKKTNYLCSTTTLKCQSTKTKTLGVPPSSSLKKALTDEIRGRDGGYITQSPDKDWVAFFVGGSDAAPLRSFFIKDIKSGNEYSVSSSTSYWDLVNDQGRVFNFSPDSKKLAYIDDKDGTLGLYVVDTTTLAESAIVSTKLATTAYQVDDFIFGDNQTIYYVGNSIDNKYLWSLHSYSLKTGKDTVIEKYVSYTSALQKIGSSIIFSRLEDKGYGPALYNLNQKKVQQFKIPSINTKPNTSNQEVIAMGTVNGVLMTPTKKDTAKAYPLLIWLHGGPYRQTSYGYHPYHSYGIYDAILELLRKDNVVVLKLDYRGSFGFGRAYAEGIKNSVGKGDVEDVMNAIEYARTRYNIGDVYLAGNSYGGYMSLRALVEHPDSFAGVISINGVTDWESLLLKMKTSIFNTEFGGLPDLNNRSFYDQASIMNKIGNIGNQKISIIAGEADRTIPYWQATDMYDKLKKADKNVTLVSYPSEDHVYAKKKTLNDLCTQMFNFVGVPVDAGCKK